MPLHRDPLTSVALTADEIAGRIRILRGQRVLLDSDLAQLYGVRTKAITKRSPATRTASQAISRSALSRKSLET